MEHPVISAAGSVTSPCQAGGVFPILGVLRAAHTKQDPFPTYLGQEVSSVSEILNEGCFHLTCHCSPLCAQGNPPSHHMNPTGTERQSQAATASGYPDPLLMEKGARLGEQTQKGLRGAISPAGGTRAASKLPARTQICTIPPQYRDG